MNKIKTADEYFSSRPKWSDELQALRSVFLETELVEEVKWGGPIYTINGKNIAGIAAFKEHFAVWFHQGVFLSDPAKKLVSAQEGVTKALRQWRFTSIDEIDSKILKDYFLEAIENQKAGNSLAPAKAKKAIIPDELRIALDADKVLSKMFGSLTPYKQKEHAEHIGGAKQDKTRISRLEKSIPLILDGKGLHDKYR